MDSLSQPHRGGNDASEHTNLNSLFGIWGIVILGLGYIGATFLKKLIDAVWEIFIADFLRSKLIDLKEYFPRKRKKKRRKK
jgi:hypothetical protein